MKNNKTKEIKNNAYPKEFYFDDCEICRATKAAYEKGESMSVEELKEVFEKQNKKTMNNFNK